MKLKHRYQMIIWIILLLAGLFAIQEFYHSQEQIAIQKAILGCTSGYPLKAVEAPSKTHVRLDFDDGLPIWIVDVKGKWVFVAGPPTEGNEPYYTDTCTIIINALNGENETELIE